MLEREIIFLTKFCKNYWDIGRKKCEQRQNGFWSLKFQNIDVLYLKKIIKTNKDKSLKEKEKVENN